MSIVKRFPKVSMLPCSSCLQYCLSMLYDFLGKVTTYGDLAKAIGKPRAFRAVGHALSKNPYAPFVPCHRVVTGKRELGGFEGSTNLLGKNLSKKRKMLEDEGVVFDESVSEEKKSKGVYRVSLASMYAFE